jgi:tetratricopeptide (TPR) repeat protein
MTSLQWRIWNYNHLMTSRETAMAGPTISDSRGGVIALVAVSGLMVSALLCASAFTMNGTFGFPLDDPWIHLQFARNLVEYGSFSYFKDEMITSGSTSPLYVLLLSSGFVLFRNEFLLSYALGVFSLTGAAVCLFAILRKWKLEPRFLCWSGATLVLLEPRLQWVALSGMETTVFIAGVFLALYFYEEKQSIGTGLSTGLLVWLRPEGLIFLAALIVDILYKRFVIRPERSRRKTGHDPAPDHRWIMRGAAVAAPIVLAYGVFNLWLSGTILPNTYAAKLAYYSSENTEYPVQVFHFLTDGHMSVLSVLAAIGVAVSSIGMVRRRGFPGPVYLLWPLLLFLAYWQKLPYLYQEGRYLMPVLPFVIVLAILGLSRTISKVQKWIPMVRKKTVAYAVTALIVVVIASQTILALWAMRQTYAGDCRYINDRQVRTALWIRDNLPPDARIATHDVGAIGFYSGRRVVDMVGLVSPSMIRNIGSFDGLNRFLVSEHATHLALLRNWFEVANQTPLFQTEEQQPEIMEVFSYVPGITSFVPQSFSRVAATASYYLSQGKAEQAGFLLDRLVQAAPGYARAHYLLGEALMRLGRKNQAESAFRLAVRIRPDFPEARRQLALLNSALPEGKKP